MSGEAAGNPAGPAALQARPKSRPTGLAAVSDRAAENPEIPLPFHNSLFRGDKFFNMPRCNPVLKSMNAYGRPAAHIVVDRKRISSFSSIVRSGLNMEEASLFFPP